MRLLAGHLLRISRPPLDRGRGVIHLHGRILLDALAGKAAMIDPMLLDRWLIPAGRGWRAGWLLHREADRPCGGPFGRYAVLIHGSAQRISGQNGLKMDIFAASRSRKSGFKPAVRGQCGLQMP